MPELELRGGWEDSHWILSTMTFPGDPTMQRNEYLLLRLTAELAHRQPSDSVSVRAEIISALIASPSKLEIREAAAANTKRGILAGDLLNALFIMAYFDLDEPSMNKAIYLSKTYNSTTTYGDGTRLPVSERMIREAWADFRNVAHLWGAFRLNDAYPFAPRTKEMFLPEHLPKFLGVAATLQTFGKKFVPKRAKTAETLLDPATMIRIPAGVRPLALNTKRRPDKIETWLRQYKAPLNNAWV